MFGAIVTFVTLRGRSELDKFFDEHQQMFSLIIALVC